MDLKHITPAITAYIANLKKRVQVDGAILYGSFAQGRARQESDVDLLILSDDFASLDEDDRLRLLYRASVGFPGDLHVYGVTPKEFSTASPLTTLGDIRQQKTLRIFPS